MQKKQNKKNGVAIKDGLGRRRVVTRGDGGSRLTAGRAKDGGQRIDLRNEVHHRAERITHWLRSRGFAWLVGGQSAPHDATRFFCDAVLGSPGPLDATSREGGGSGEGDGGAHFRKIALQTSNLHARDTKTRESACVASKITAVRVGARALAE